MRSLGDEWHQAPHTALKGRRHQPRPLPQAIKTSKSNLKNPDLLQTLWTELVVGSNNDVRNHLAEITQHVWYIWPHNYRRIDECQFDSGFCWSSPRECWPNLNQPMNLRLGREFCWSKQRCLWVPKIWGFSCIRNLSEISVVEVSYKRIQVVYLAELVAQLALPHCESIANKRSVEREKR